MAIVRSREILAKLEDLDLNLRKRRLYWYGHLEHFSDAILTACDKEVDGGHWPGRPKMTGKLMIVDPHERKTWRLA